MAYPIARRLLGKYLLGRIKNLQGTEFIPKEGATLFVSNHVGWHEPLLAYAAIVIYGGHRRVHTLARWPIFKIPVFQRWTGGIPIYEDKQKTVTIASKVLHQGGNVLIFPEGGTSQSETISEVKTGAARFALASRCTVIPIGMKRVSKQPKSFFMRLMEILFADIEMRFGEPINLSAWYDKEITRELLYEVTDCMMRRVAHLAGKQYIRR